MTKTEATRYLNTSRGTLYRHIDKLGIDKSKELTMEDIERIEQSIKLTKSNTQTTSNQHANSSHEINTQLHGANAKLVAAHEQIDKLNEQIAELNNKILLLEKDNRALVSDLANSVTMHNEMNNQYSTFMLEMKYLMEPKKQKNKWWQRRNRPATKKPEQLKIDQNSEYD